MTQERKRFTKYNGEVIVTSTAIFAIIINMLLENSLFIKLRSTILHIVLHLNRLAKLRLFAIFQNMSLQAHAKNLDGLYVNVKLNPFPIVK